MSESPVETLKKALGLHFISKMGLTCLWQLESHVEFTTSNFDDAWCKTQNSGLCSKEEKPRDPINEPSRCNKQEGLLSAAQPGDSDLLGGRAPRTANWTSFYRQKTILSACYIRVTKWLVTRLQSNPVGTDFAGYMFTKQSYWYKRRGLFTGGGESHHFMGNRNPSPGCLPAPAPAAPAAPHNKTYFSASKTNKKNIRHI